jgi:uncharacterized membrane protein HdeD (DUF308 family)
MIWYSFALIQGPFIRFNIAFIAEDTFAAAIIPSGAAKWRDDLRRAAPLPILAVNTKIEEVIMTGTLSGFDMGKDFRRFALIAGILLMGLGVIGVALPQFMTLITAAFAGWILLLAGFVTAYLTSKGFGGIGALRWLKPFVLVATGLLILVYPIAGAAALGLMLAIYFMFDGFANAGMALEMRPMRGWTWMLLNAALSFALSLFIMAGWPDSSFWIVGIYVGVSLFFDGLALLAIRRFV